MSLRDGKVHQAWPAAAAFAVNGGLYGGLLSRYAELANGYNAGPAEFGAILTASAFGGLAGSLVAPLVMRSWSIAFATGVAGVAYSLLSTSLAFAPGAVVAAVSFFIVGVADGGHDVSINALTLKFQQRLGIPLMGRAHAIWSLALAAGAAIGAAAAALHVPPAIHLAIMGLLCTSLQLVAARRVLRANFSTQNSTPSGGRGDRHSFRKGIAVIKGPLVLAIAITAIAASYIEGPGQDWSAILLSDAFNASAGVAAAAPLALSLGLVTSRLSMDTLRRHCKPRTLAGVAAGLVAVAGAGGYLATQFDAPAWTALALFLVIGLGAGPLYPMLFDTAGTLSSRYGIQLITTSGMISACSRIGAITAPAIVGHLANVSGVSVVFFIIAIAGSATAMGLPSTLKDSNGTD